MTDSKLVVIGASAGGVEALIKVTEMLPHDLNAAVLVVIHMSPTAKSALPQILSRGQRLAATYPIDGQRIQPGRIYVAPPDWHMMLLNSKQITLTRGPREHACRPAIDPLFRSAAAVYGRDAIGVILSGTLDDGSAGIQAIKQSGGIAIVQHPKDALFSGMPLGAIEHTVPDFIVPASEIGDLIGVLCKSDNVSFVPAKNVLEDIEIRIDALKGGPEDTKKLGAPAEFGCPECGGALWAIHSGDEERYRCRVGHAYSVGTLMDEQTLAMERALWTAYRALREKAELAKRVAKRMRTNDHAESALRFERQAITAEREAERLLQLFRLRSSDAANENGIDLVSDEAAVLERPEIAERTSIGDESL
jgi:two-component system chemotaxis response regulator CheB